MIAADQLFDYGGESVTVETLGVVAELPLLGAVRRHLGPLAQWFAQSTSAKILNPFRHWMCPRVSMYRILRQIAQGQGASVSVMTDEMIGGLESGTSSKLGVGRALPMRRLRVAVAVRWLLCERHRLPLLLLLLTLMLPLNAWSSVDVVVKVVGVEGELRDNVRAYLSLEQRKSEDSLTDRWVKILHGDAPDEIRAALAPFGYYNVQVDSSLEQVEGKWLARYDIVPGEPVRVTDLDLRYLGEGAQMPELATALTAFPLQPGDVLDDQRYESGKSKLLFAAARLGYAKAEPVVARVLVEPESNTAKVILHVDTGPRYYIGEVRFHQDFLNAALLAKTVSLTPGDPYVNSEVLAFQQGLQVTDWASVVAVDPRFDEAVDGRVPIDVSLQPSNRNRFLIGVGYETDVGPRMSARWIQRRINGGGHHAETFLRLSSVRRNIRFAYFVPVRQPVTDRLSTSAEYEYEKTSDTERNTLNGEFAFIRRSLDDRRFNKAFLELKHEKFKVGAEPPDESTLLSIGFARRFTELGTDPYPLRGHYNGFEVRGASSQIVSDTSYARLIVGTKYLLPLGDNGRFRLAGDLGFSLVEDFEKYPTSLRFFAGGDSSIRGYQYKSLGPEDEFGNVAGGKNLLVLSGEYDHRIKPRWAVAGFVDGGNAYNDTLDEINIGAGAGFRWLMDFGSLRVDLAWPVSDADVTVGDVFVHLGFGAAL
jgi:translocation and assembly module TamA